MLSSTSMAQGLVRIRRATNGLSFDPLIGVLRIHSSVTFGRSAEQFGVWTEAMYVFKFFFQKVNSCVVSRISRAHNYAVKMPVRFSRPVKCRIRRRVRCFCYYQRVGCISENPKSESSREFMSKRKKKRFFVYSNVFIHAKNIVF